MMRPGSNRLAVFVLTGGGSDRRHMIPNGGTPDADLPLNAPAGRTASPHSAVIERTHKGHFRTPDRRREADMFVTVRGRSRETFGPSALKPPQAAIKTWGQSLDDGDPPPEGARRTGRPHA